MPRRTYCTLPSAMPGSRPASFLSISSSIRSTVSRLCTSISLGMNSTSKRLSRKDTSAIMPIESMTPPVMRGMASSMVAAGALGRKFSAMYFLTSVLISTVQSFRDSAQGQVIDLAPASLGNGIHKQDVVGHHVRRQCARTVGLGFDQGEGACGANPDKGSYDGSSPPILASNHSRLQYIFMASQCSLNFPQLYAEAAALYLPVQPSDKQVAVVRRQRHAVTGAVILFAVQPDEGALCIFGTVPVAIHQRVAAREQFAALSVHRDYGVGAGMADG